MREDLTSGSISSTNREDTNNTAGLVKTRPTLTLASHRTRQRPPARPPARLYDSGHRNMKKTTTRRKQTRARKEKRFRFFTPTVSPMSPIVLMYVRKGLKVLIVLGARVMTLSRPGGYAKATDVFLRRSVGRSVRRSVCLSVCRSDGRLALTLSCGCR